MSMVISDHINVSPGQTSSHQSIEGLKLLSTLSIVLPDEKRMSTVISDHGKVTFLSKENSCILLLRVGNYSQLNKQLPVAHHSIVGVLH